MITPETDTNPSTATLDLPALAISLLKGVIYRDTDVNLWNALIQLQARVRDYMSVLSLDLDLDEAEGYAFLRSRAEPDDAAPGKSPRLIARRPLSFPVSLLLALLRKKLAEFDARGGEEGAAQRLVLSLDEIADTLRLFLPDNSNEARLTDQTQTHLNKIIELGFVRKLKANAVDTGKQPATYEVRRILKAFVDAQWLAEFDGRLAAYKSQLGGVQPGADAAGVRDE